MDNQLRTEIERALHAQFESVDSGLLLAIVQKMADAGAVAALVLAERGLDKQGRIVGRQAAHDSLGQ